jgi:hypothetical protein
MSKRKPFPFLDRTQSKGNVDSFQAAYWSGNVTRTEVQGVFDELAQAAIATQQQIIKHEFALSYLLEKLGITPDELTSWMEAKAAELKAKAQTTPAEIPVEEPKVLLN